MGWIVVHLLKKCILLDSVSRSFLGYKVVGVMIEVARPWIENLGVITTFCYKKYI